MSAPSTLPRWADVAGAIVTPTSGKLDIGWVAGERPPAQYLNWWMNLVYQWIKYKGGSSWTWWQPIFSTSLTRGGGGTTSVGTGSTYQINLSNEILDIIPIRTYVGETIFSIGAVEKGDGANAVGCNLYRDNVDGTTDLIQPFSLSSSNAAFTMQKFDLTTPLVVADGCSYHIMIGSTTGACTIKAVGARIGSVA